jgi:putative long chain acyl-CoA synthase
VVVAAVSVRDGAALTADDLTRATARLPVEHRPAVVWVIDRMPVTTWYRPRKQPLRDRGLPDAGPGVWRRDGDGYVATGLSVATGHG